MNRSSNRSTLFLTELIIDLFIFIVCAAVCVGILVRAHGISRESATLTESIYIAQTAAEYYRAGRFPPGFYRADGSECPRAEAAYTIVMTEFPRSANGHLRSASIQVLSIEGEQKIPRYTLTVKAIRGGTTP